MGVACVWETDRQTDRFKTAGSGHTPHGNAAAEILGGPRRSFCVRIRALVPSKRRIAPSCRTSQPFFSQPRTPAPQPASAVPPLPSSSFPTRDSSQRGAKGLAAQREDDVRRLPGQCHGRQCLHRLRTIAIRGRRRGRRRGAAVPRSELRVSRCVRNPQTSRARRSNTRIAQKQTHKHARANALDAHLRVLTAPSSPTTRIAIRIQTQANASRSYAPWMAMTARTTLRR